MGVNQGHEAVRTAQALINLALLTGNIGRPGTGANSITGQCNAMGSRLFSNTTCLLGGHEFENPEHRAKVAGILGIDEARIPRRTSLAYDQILAEIRAGRIRGALGDRHEHRPLVDPPERGCARRSRQLDLLVVQDLYATTETAQLADLVLPAAGWGEKDGTFINSERRIGLMRKVRRAPGQALADFHIFRLVAEAWGCGELFARWQQPEDVFADDAGDSRAASPATSPASPATGCSKKRAACSGRCARESRSRPSAACSKTAASTARTRERGSASRRRGRFPNRPTRLSRCC